MSYEVAVALGALSVLSGGLLVLWLKAEAANARLIDRLRELQEKRVKDVQYYADRPGSEREAEVEDVGTPESRAQEAVRELDKEVAFDFLKRKAQEEGKQVSEAKLQEDAEKLARRWGVGAKPPNVG